jgi:nucleoid-associated protein YgaU
MKNLTVAGGNLYEIALDQLGDATQWTRIAELNGLIDPVLNGIITLQIPDTDPDAGGGIYGNP